MFPTTDSILSADALRQQVMPRYSIGEIARLELHERGINDTYKVGTADGDTYYLRVYRFGWRTIDEINSEIAVLRHIAGRSAPVSAPVERTDGEILTSLDCAEGERWAVLFTLAPGARVDYKVLTDEQAACYGEAAASIHEASDSFVGKRSRETLDLTTLLERPLQALTLKLAHRRDDQAYVTQLGERLRADVEASAGLETGFCHGDLHDNNANYADGNITIFDFDCCGWGYRAYDLAVFPWAFAVVECERPHIEAMGRAFLRGYRRRRVISDADFAAIPLFVPIRQIWLLGLHVHLAGRFGSGWFNDGYLDRQLAMLRDWEANFLNRPAAEWLAPDRQ
jgi:Ser/Thr protein kinase RdoA (MazF antagonist)